jgi:uncharacterized membrane protein
MRRHAQTVATALGTLGLLTPAWAQERAWDWGGHPMWGMWGVWGFGMMLVMLTFWVLVIVGLIALASAGSSRRAAHRGRTWRSTSCVSAMPAGRSTRRSSTRRSGT